jgi:hypothetical protein
VVSPSSTFEPTRSVLLGAPAAGPMALDAEGPSLFAAFPGCTDVQIQPDCINVTFTRGDTLTIVLNVWDNTAQTIPSNLTGATVTAQVRTTPDSTTVEATFAVTKSGNQVTLRLTPGQTRVLSPSCAWDCQVDWISDGSDVRTIVQGDLSVLQDVTRIP